MSSERRLTLSESTPAGSMRNIAGMPRAKVMMPPQLAGWSSASMTSQTKAKRWMPCTIENESVFSHSRRNAGDSNASSVFSAPRAGAASTAGAPVSRRSTPFAMISRV